MSGIRESMSFCCPLSPNTLSLIIWIFTLSTFLPPECLTLWNATSLETQSLPLAHSSIPIDELRKCPQDEVARPLFKIEYGDEPFQLIPTERPELTQASLLSLAKKRAKDDPEGEKTRFSEELDLLKTFMKSDSILNNPGNPIHDAFCVTLADEGQVNALEDVNE